MMRKSATYRLTHAHGVAVIFLLFACAVAGCLTWHLEQYRSKDARIRIADLSGNHASAMERHIGHTRPSTYSLAARVRRGNGVIADLEAARQTLTFYPVVAALEHAPGGAVYLDSRYV